MFGALRAAGDSVLRSLGLDAIEPNPEQPRRTIDPQGLEALAASISERGVLQPVIVRPLAAGRYQLIAGERRWRASRIAGRTTIPALVRDAADTLALELALIENLARHDLSPGDEARALRTLIDDLQITQADLAARLGRSRADLANSLRLLELPHLVLHLLDAGTPTKGHGKVLLGEPDPQRRMEFARRAAQDGWSVRRLEYAIRAVQTRSPRPSTTNEAHGSARRLQDELRRHLPAADGVVRPHRNGYTIRLCVASVEQAQALIRRLHQPPEPT